MAERELRQLLDGGAFFEGPRWHEGRWWVSDFYRRQVSTVDADGREERVLEVPEQPSGLGWMPDGSLLVVSRKDFKLLRRTPDGEVSEHADLSEHATGHLNDMVVDGRGRAFVGNFGFDRMAGADPAPTVLIRVDPDGAVTRRCGRRARAGRRPPPGRAGCAPRGRRRGRARARRPRGSR
jgi:sugar lactone lactonase YvrE